ncbi:MULTISPECIES: hypothetical protein [Serratia]|uniref:hypothetical protein n=1 Tax=Serratia TaxID=613 RepID=UPI0018D7A037|nr:hypothetical protein [Serratia ureilytica]MBH2617041.1 hypothetical protein [Serratia ureilytica]
MRRRIGCLCREAGLTGQVRVESVSQFEHSVAMFYTWRKKYGRILYSKLKNMWQLEEENLRLTKLVVDQSLDKTIMLQDALAKKG